MINRFLGEIKKKIMVINILIISLLCIDISSPIYAQEDYPDELFISSLQGVEPAAIGRNLAVVKKSEMQSPKGRKYFSAKIMDKETGEIYGITIDHHGNRIEDETSYQQVQADYHEVYGKLDIELINVLQSVKSDMLVDILISMKIPGGILKGPDEDEAVYKNRIREITQPLVRELEFRGIPIKSISNSYPLISAAIPAGIIHDISSREDVEMIYLEKIAFPEINITKSVIQAETVWNRGWTGTLVRVGLSESGGKAQTANPYLSLLDNWTPYSCAFSDHGTAVTGIIKAYSSTDTVYRGMAYNSQLYYAGACDGSWTNLLNGWNRLSSSFSVHVQNNSWGSDTNRIMGAMDKEADSRVRNNRIFMVKSSGNQGASGCLAGSDGDITSPGLSYNIMTVGWFDDKRTSSYIDDQMAPCSSWGDPQSASGDREKPEVAAPGSNINSTLNRTSSPWIGSVDSGSSYAAPMVASGAALLMQRNTVLKAEPEAVKAILMASSWNKVKDPSGSTGTYPKDEYAGAGGIRLDYADDVVRGYRGGWWSTRVTSSSFDSSGYLYRYFYLPAGARARVAIAWSSDPTYGTYNASHRPSSDLDLTVLSPSGYSTGSSLSWDNTHEIVEFTTSVSGTYTIRVKKYRWSEPSNYTYLGIAVNYQ